MDKKSSMKWKKKDELNFNGLEIMNAIVSNVGIEFAGHFGNAVGLRFEVNSEDSFHGCFMGGYNFTRDIGYVCKAIYETLSEPTDDTVDFDMLAGKPLRIVCDGSSYVGIGHFMKDRWLMASDVLEQLRAQD